MCSPNLLLSNNFTRIITFQKMYINEKLLLLTSLINKFCVFYHFNLRFVYKYDLISILYASCTKLMHTFYNIKSDKINYLFCLKKPGLSAKIFENIKRKLYPLFLCLPTYLIHFVLSLDTALAPSFRPLTSLSYLFRTSMRYCLSPLLISLTL